MIDKPKPNAGDQAVRQLHAGDRSVNVRLAEARRKAETGGLDRKGSYGDLDGGAGYQPDPSKRGFTPR